MSLKLPKQSADGHWEQCTVQIFNLPKANFLTRTLVRIWKATSSLGCRNVAYITPSRLVPHSEQNFDVSRMYAEPHSSQYFEGPVAWCWTTEPCIPGASKSRGTWGGVCTVCCVSCWCWTCGECWCCWCCSWCCCWSCSNAHDDTYSVSYVSTSQQRPSTTVILPQRATSCKKGSIDWT